MLDELIDIIIQMTDEEQKELLSIIANKQY